MAANHNTADFNSALNTLIQSIKDAATKQYCRYVVVLAGENEWCKTTAQHIIEELKYTNHLWVSDEKSETSISIKKAKQLLGHEHELVVFDAHYGFDPDAFGVLTNTVLGGGMFLLLVPTLNDWPAYEDPQNNRIAIWPYRANEVSGRFLQRFVQVLQCDKHALIIEQNKALPKRNIPATTPISKNKLGYLEKHTCATVEQQQAVEAIIHVVKGHRRRPLVITSDRGRGKSSALGIAAAQLLQQDKMSIVVTAPLLSSVSSLFTRVSELCPGTYLNGRFLSVGQTTLQYFPPDELLRTALPCQLLFVDEAAAIPNPILEKLLKQYSRIVFATTVHGYEGTGRGFAVRFQKTLDTVAPGWSHIRLTMPIRWTVNDPLEDLTFRALLLDAEAADEKIATDLVTDSCLLEKIDRDLLINSEQTLSELFGLLVLAHYQTQPADLRYLLDGMDLEVYIIRHNNHVVATALLEKEGCLDEALASGVYENRRRVRGHLIPQSLASYSGFKQATNLRYFRVVRIAVHPAAQRLGLGAHLLNSIVAKEKQSFDIIGASFGATTDLLTFWQSCGFKPVSLGLKRNSSSGEHSVIVLNTTSNAGEQLVTGLRKRFLDQLPHLLSDSLQDLNLDLIQQLMREPNAADLTVINKQDWRDIQSFAYTLRGYEANCAALWKLCSQAVREPSVGELFNEAEKTVLYGKVLQKKSWQDLADEANLAGRDEVIKILRSVTSKLYSYYRASEVYE